MIAACCGFCLEARKPRTQGFGPTVTCACGCGTTFPQFDSVGRERRFAHGHYTRTWASRIPRGETR
jgi:hypothetical protein